MIIPHLGFGGAERSFLRIAQFLGNSCEVSVGIMSRTNPEESGIESVLPPHTKLYYLAGEIKPIDSIFSKVYRWYIMLLHLRKIKAKSDVVISFLSGANLLNAISGYRSKTIVSLRGSRILDIPVSYRSHLLWSYVLDPLIYMCSTKIVCASEGIKSEVSNRFPIVKSRLVAIEGSVDTGDIFRTLFFPVEPNFRKFEAFPTVISYGRLHKAKGYDFLIKIFSEIKCRIPDAKLVLIGEGPEDEHLARLAFDSGLKVCFTLDSLNSDVFMIGYRKHPHRYLKFCSVFAFTSRGEGLPNALIEALSTGTPILSADCSPGIRSILALKNDTATVELRKQCDTPTYGKLLPPPDSPDAFREWTAALFDALSVSKPPRSEQLCREAVGRFDIETTGPVWLEIVTSIYQSQSSRGV